MSKGPESSKNRPRIKPQWFVIIAVIILTAVSFVAFSLIQSSDKNEVSESKQIAPSRADANGAFFIPNPEAPIQGKVNPDSVRVDMFFDLQCPGCGIVDRAIGERVQELVESDEISLYLTPVAFLDSASEDRYSTRAANAFVTVAQESPEHALPFMHSLYAEDVQPGEGNDYASLSDEDLARIAIESGVSESVAETFSEHKYFKWISESTLFQQNREDLFSTGFSTPSVFLGATLVDDSATGAKRVQFDDADVLKTFNTALKEYNEEK